MTAALEGGEWSAARPSRTLPPGKTRYPLYRRLKYLEVDLQKCQFVHQKFHSKCPEFVQGLSTLMPVTNTQLLIKAILIPVAHIPIRPRRPDNFDSSQYKSHQLVSFTCAKARHLMTECSLLSKQRPTVPQNLPLPLTMQHHTNTVDVSRFLKTIFYMLQYQSKRDRIP